MKVAIVGDVHGRPFWKKAKEKIDEVDQVVFLGDYLDPYSHEGITIEEAIDNFKEILEFRNHYPNKVILLIGNHDSSYIWDVSLCECRHDYKHDKEIRELFSKNIDSLRLYYSVPGYLFSHAGIYEEWVITFLKNGLDLNIASLKEWNETQEWQCLGIYDFYRGGYSHYGSCIWADIRDSFNNKLWKEDEYYQIVGHTQLESKPYIGDKIACLDVRRCFVLDTETRKIEEL